VRVGGALGEVSALDPVLFFVERGFAEEVEAEAGEAFSRSVFVGQ